MRLLLNRNKLPNLNHTISYLLSLLNVKYTNSNLEELIENHVDSPSLLTIKDVLMEYGLESVVVRKDNYSYKDFETPFICFIQQEGWSHPAFTVVTSNDNERIEFLDPERSALISIGLADFETMDKNVVMLLDTEHKKDELDYIQNRRKEKKKKLTSNLPVYALVAIFLIAFALMYFGSGPLLWSSPFFLTTSAIGLIISSILIWHEIDEHNPFIKEVCGGQGRKMNCDSVLSSPGATFLGVSWAVWGFVYFATKFLSMLLFLQPSYLYVWAIISIVCTSYIPFSLFYQSQIVKQWCPLCLSVLGVLLVNSIASVFILTSNELVFNSIYPIFHIATVGLIFLVSTSNAIPLIKHARESKSYATRWKKLRYNPEIFQALLEKSEKINVATDGLGIVVGNPKAQNEIIKVCNPYCGPCSKAHPDLERIIKNNSDVKVRIIFTASGEEDDVSTGPVRHLLALQEKYGKDVVHQALDDWYLAEKKDYEFFAKKYPLEGDFKEQKANIEAMRDWCNDMKIRATPTIYINGAELPDTYSVSELKNFY